MDLGCVSKSDLMLEDLGSNCPSNDILSRENLPLLRWAGLPIIKVELISICGLQWCDGRDRCVVEILGVLVFCSERALTSEGRPLVDCSIPTQGRKGEKVMRKKEAGKNYMTCLLPSAVHVKIITRECTYSNTHGLSGKHWKAAKKGIWMFPGETAQFLAVLVRWLSC